MSTIKYLKLVQRYEREYKSYEQLIKYFIDHKSLYTNHVCEGETYLPSFMLLKKAKAKYEDLCNIDDELKRLFDSAINCSKLFYAKIFKLVQAETNSDTHKFESKFEKNLQPIGQQLINLLTNIKYRIKVVKLKKIRTDNKRKKISYWLFDCANGIISIFNNIAYKTTLLASTNHNMVRKTYYILIFSAIVSIWILNFLFLNNISKISSAFINIISGISIVLFAIMSYPIGDFAKKDISGKNVVAYKYKVLLNQKKNSKLINIFTLQQGNEINLSRSSAIQD